MKVGLVVVSPCSQVYRLPRVIFAKSQVYKVHSCERISYLSLALDPFEPLMTPYHRGARKACCTFSLPFLDKTLDTLRL
jgi:hypothetical protein